MLDSEAELVAVLVPQDWRKQNTRSAMSAVSPANDAAMQLTIADEATASSAASAFLAAPELNDAGSRGTMRSRATP